MCGLAGLLSFLPSRNSQNNKEILTKMSQAISRRGPDDEQFYFDDSLSFVFRRLSIIDINGGQQPIWNADKTIFVAVNGEIYNHKDLREELQHKHRFTTESDSEVALHIYIEHGIEGFKKLNGMFAITIWDSIKQELILARDPLGIKPLYYAKMDDGLVFGSELKALLMHPNCPRELDWDDLKDIGIQQKPEVSTYVKGVNYLQGGEYLIANSKGYVKIEKFWDISNVQITDMEAASFQSCYDETLEDAINRQLMSDVPVGLFLSGGIDSSLIASVAKKYNQNIHCFSIAEPTTIASGDLEQAIKVTSELNLPLHVGIIDAVSLIQRFELIDFERMITLIESPRFDPEWLFKYELHKFVKEQVPNIKVILLGQGADEFAGGYSRMYGDANQSWNEYISNNVTPSLEYYTKSNQSIPDRFNDLFEEEFVENLAKGPLDNYQTQMRFLVAQLQYFNLWHEDRTSSFNSIESRVPYLDHRLVELLASIPEHLHEELFWDKKIVRDCLKKHAPTYPDDKAKIPFFALKDTSSIDELVFLLSLKLYNSFKQKYLEIDEPIFDWTETDKLYNEVANKHGNFVDTAWRLIEVMSISIFYEQCLNSNSLLDIVTFKDDEIIPKLDETYFNNLEGIQFKSFGG